MNIFTRTFFITGNVLDGEKKTILDPLEEKSNDVSLSRDDLLVSLEKFENLEAFFA